MRIFFFQSCLCLYSVSLRYFRAAHERNVCILFVIMLLYSNIHELLRCIIVKQLLQCFTCISHVRPKLHIKTISDENRSIAYGNWATGPKGFKTALGQTHVFVPLISKKVLATFTTDKLKAKIKPGCTEPDDNLLFEYRQALKVSSLRHTLSAAAHVFISLILLRTVDSLMNFITIIIIIIIIIIVIIIIIMIICC